MRKPLLPHYLQGEFFIHLIYYLLFRNWRTQCWKAIPIWAFYLSALQLTAENTDPAKIIASITAEMNCSACDNVITGGQIQSNETGCPNPAWDPSPITSVSLPTGGTGILEYVWIYTTGDPNEPLAQWTPIPGSNSPNFDPTPISETTHYRRCARRAGCIDYIGESNVITKTVDCCDNVTSGGAIGPDQKHCGVSFDPAPIGNLTLPGGGSGNLEYQWVKSFTGSPYAAGNADWTTIPGAQGESYDVGSIVQTTYFIRLARRNGCNAYPGISNMVTLGVYPAVSASTAGTNITCSGGTNGAINLTVSGGKAPFQYQWNGGIGNVEDPQGIGAGNYTVTVTDANGCTASSGANLLDGINIVVTVQGTNETCFGSNNGTATVTDASGGVPSYSYKWNDGAAQSGATASNLAPGNYVVTVTDSQGCTGSASVSLQNGPKLELNIQGTNESCLGANNCIATVVNTTGGVPAYTYKWNDTAAQSGATASNLAPGNYVVTVTDSQGCTGSASVSLQNGPKLELNVQGTNESCFGANNCTAGVVGVTGGIGPYLFLWNAPGNQTSQYLTNLAPGTYTATVTDSQGCTGSASLTLNEGPMLSMQMASNPVKCIGSQDGNATVLSVAGGIGPFTYQWSDATSQTTQTADGLKPGSYQVTVHDTQGCIGTGSASVANAVPLSLITSHTDAQCGNIADGTATVEAAGGVAPYSYLWNDPASQTSKTANNLAAGTYKVTVTDANGCTSIATETVQAPMQAIVLTSATNAACHGAANGSVSVSIQNGNPADFDYLWSDPAASTNIVVTGLTAGTYTVTVTDDNGCMEIATATISQPSALSLSLESKPASCSDSSDGSATVIATGGTPQGNGNYQYKWSAAGNPAVAVLDDVSAGSYLVTVTDANGCSATGSIGIDAPVALSVQVSGTPVTCFGSANGSATASASGGTAPFAYQWNVPGTNSQSVLNNLPPANYIVTVTDSHGCSATAQTSITEPGALSLTLTKTDVICDDDNTGNASPEVSGGITPYQYNWNTGAGTANLNSLTKGTYSLTVTDANGCTVSKQVTIVATTTLSSSVAATNAKCSNSSDGVATATANGGTAPYSYAWNNGASGAVASNLAAGSYKVTITDAEGCTVQNTVQIGAPSQLTCQTQLVSAISTFGGSNGGASVSANGGIAPYTYNWASGSTNQTASNLSAGTQNVTVTDNNGCTCVTQITMSNPSKIGNLVWNDIDQDGVQDAGEPGIENIIVRLFGVTGTGNEVNMVTSTASNGQYAFDGLKTGFYHIEVDLPANHLYTLANVGVDGTDSDLDPVSGASEPFLLGSAYYDERWDAGLIVLDEKINIGDFVWEDYDRNGIQDVNEQGLEGIPVKLIALPGNTVSASTTTNALGRYRFTDVLPGTYQVEFSLATLPNGYIFSPKNQGPDDTIDSDPDPATGRTDPFEVLPFSLDNLTLDAGIFKECDNVTGGGLIGYDEDLCGIGNDPAEIVNLSLPEGGFGTPEYLWLSSLVPVYNGPGDPNWTPIPNSNNANYNPGPIAQTTYYIRCSRRQGCEDYPGETNIVAKKITPEPLTQMLNAPDLLCVLQNGSFEAAIAGGGTIYAWEFGPGATPQTALTRAVDAVNWSSAGLKTVKLTVTRLGCSSSVTKNVQVNSCGSNLVVFDDIQASLDEGKVVVDWKIKGDASNTMFFVQRSENGQQFENLTALAGSKQPGYSSYQFEDYRPRLGDNMYRIKYKKMDNSALEGYSAVVTTFYRPKNSALAQVYPNPASGAVTIELLKPNDSPASVKITSPFGKVLEAKVIAAKSEKIELDLSLYPQGIYLICIKQKGFREQVCRVVKGE